MNKLREFRLWLKSLSPQEIEALSTMVGTVLAAIILLIGLAIIGL